MRPRCQCCDEFLPDNDHVEIECVRLNVIERNAERWRKVEALIEDSIENDSAATHRAMLPRKLLDLVIGLWAKDSSHA